MIGKRMTNTESIKFMNDEIDNATYIDKDKLNEAIKPFAHELKNDSYAKTINKLNESFKSSSKSFNQFSLAMGCLYQQLKWHQKLWLWLCYKFEALKFWR